MRPVLLCTLRVSFSRLIFNGNLERRCFVQPPVFEDSQLNSQVLNKFLFRSPNRKAAFYYEHVNKVNTGKNRTKLLSYYTKTKVNSP